MAQSKMRYTEAFKRQAVARVTASPNEAATIARELGVPRSTLFNWRKQYALAPVSSLQHSDGEGDEGQTPETEADAQNQRLRQSLLDTAFTLTHAIREATENAPLNQLSAALGLVIDRLLKLEAQKPNLSLSVSEELIRIEYKDSDGSLHHSPPWARGDPAFEDPVSRGRVRSPFWEDRDGQADDSGDGPARG